MDEQDGVPLQGEIPASRHRFRFAFNMNSAQGRPRVPPFVTLAWWQVRPVWHLLLMTGVGIIVAVAFVCIVPLYSDITMTAGLRNTLTSPAPDTDIAVSGTAQQMNTYAIRNTTLSLNSIVAHDLGPFMQSVQFSIQTGEYPLMTQTAGSNGQAQYGDTLNSIAFVSAPTKQMVTHITVLRGRLPRTSDKAIEVALTAQSARQLNVSVGSALAIQVGFGLLPQYQTPQTQETSQNVNVPLQVVGIINPPAADDPYWHGNTFLSSDRGQGAGSVYTGMTSSEGYLAYFSQIFSQSSVYGLSVPCRMLWYYAFDAPHVTIYDLQTILNGVKNFRADVGNDPLMANYPFLSKTATILPLSPLQQYQTLTEVGGIPATSLLLLLVGFVLFFVGVMTGILVDRQLETIALLRSRGASRWQVLLAFVTQSVILSLIGLLVGPVLAFVAVILIVMFVLPTAAHGSVNIVFNHFTVILGRLGWYPLLTAFVAVLISIFALAQRVSSDILTIRRESARQTERPFWQRLNLDILAMVVAMTGFSLSWYVVNSVPDSQKVNILFVSPITLLGIIALVLAGILLFLRLFPLLLRLGMWWTLRGRGAAPMLAMAQIARAPRQPLRITLLLSLAITLVVFALMFMASQSQRIIDVANYRAGADFSGKLQDNSFSAIDRTQLTTHYRRIPGVLAASVGDVAMATASVNTPYSLPIQVNAVDTSTFAQTAIWTGQDSPQSLSSLLSPLIMQRNAAIKTDVIPAIIDQPMWDALNLSPGVRFALLFDDASQSVGPVHFVAVAEVSHIPTINDSSLVSSDGVNIVSGGIIIDYQTFAQVYTHDFSSIGASVPINYVWLKTRDDDASLQSVRNVLNNPGACCLQLSNINDRQGIMNSLRSDPLYLNIIGLLVIGALFTIVLTLCGYLITSWQQVRSRLIQFVLLHALGASSRQVASVLTWEQGIMYIAGTGLGTLAGLLLAIFALPSLIYTSALASAMGSDFTPGKVYLAQNVPPLQIVFPLWSLWLFALLLLIFVITLVIMVRVVRKPAMAQTLRINVD